MPFRKQLVLSTKKNCADLLMREECRTNWPIISPKPNTFFDNFCSWSIDARTRTCGHDDHQKKSIYAPL